MTRTVVLSSHNILENITMGNALDIIYCYDDCFKNGPFPQIKLSDCNLLIVVVQVAWVTKSGQSELAEPIAIRPTSETGKLYLQCTSIVWNIS